MNWFCAASQFLYKQTPDTIHSLTSESLKPIINPSRGIFALFVISALFLFACNKEPDLIGLDLIPDGDKMHANIMDTTTIVAYSVLDDSVLTSSMSYGVIGSIYDEVFGKTTASLYAQIRLSTNAPSFGTSPVVDSVVLILPYSGLFGDSTALQTFSVYELTEAMDADKEYFSNNPGLAFNSALPLAVQTFLPRVSDSVVVDSATKIIPQLRLKFNEPAFGQKIMSASATNLENNDNFTTYFKGIVITANPENTPGKGSLVSFNILSTSSYLKMYYHNSTDTLVYNFGITSASARFNRYEHYGYAQASQDFKTQVLNHDTIQGKQKLFIQAFGGSKVRLRFPNLKKWASDNNYKIAVNNAQLIMSNADVNSLFSAPAKLTIRKILTDSTQSILVDENEGSGYFDGTYNSVKEYRFRISHYIQQLMDPETEDKGLYLFAPGSSYIGNRLILNGTATETGKMRLVITYTKIK
jgi:hypothetical protein